MVTKGTSQQLLWPLDGAEPAVLEIEFSDTVSDQSFDAYVMELNKIFESWVSFREWQVLSADPYSHMLQGHQQQFMGQVLEASHFQPLSMLLLHGWFWSVLWPHNEL